MQSPIYTSSSSLVGNSLRPPSIPKHTKFARAIKKAFPSPPTYSTADLAALFGPSPPNSNQSDQSDTSSSPDSMKRVVDDLDQFDPDYAASLTDLPYVPTSPDYAPDSPFYNNNNNNQEYNASLSPSLSQPTQTSLSSQPASNKRMRK